MRIVVNPLTVASLMRSRYINVYVFKDSDEFILELMNRELVETVSSSGYESYTFNDAGRAYAAQALNAWKELHQRTDSSNFNEELADRMWVLTLTMGGIINYYSSDGVAESEETLHVLSCGINAKESKAPYVDGWESFTDTYSPSQQNTGLVAEVTCVCGAVRETEVQAVIESGSIVSMLASMG